MGSLTYQRITHATRLKVIYLRKIHKQGVAFLSRSLNLKYNSVRNILRAYDKNGRTNKKRYFRPSLKGTRGPNIHLQDSLPPSVSTVGSRCKATAPFASAFTRKGDGAARGSLTGIRSFPGGSEQTERCQGSNIFAAGTSPLKVDGSKVRIAWADAESDEELTEEVAGLAGHETGRIASSSKLRKQSTSGATSKKLSPYVCWGAPEITCEEDTASAGRHSDPLDYEKVFLFKPGCREYPYSNELSEEDSSIQAEVVDCLVRELHGGIAKVFGGTLSSFDRVMQQQARGKQPQDRHLECRLPRPNIIIHQQP